MVPATLRTYAAPAALTSLAATVAFAAAGPTAFGGNVAPASHVQCGDTITADTTLENDLVDCPNNGIVIGADGITLDLNGHTVDGNREPVERCPRNQPCDVGLLNDGHDGVAVRNGAVREFGAGVVVGRARDNRLVGISSSRNQFFGFVIAESARSLVRDSSGNDNPGPDGDGIGVFRSRHLRILDSSFRRNELAMHVEDSSDVLIKGNVFARNPGPGILMQADGNQVRGNRCVRNAACVIVGPGSRNVIARNRSTRDGEAIAIEKGRRNLVALNVVVRARGDGIRLGIGNPAIGGVDTVVRRNLVRASGDDAFLVAKSDRGALLQANIARGSGGDGFQVRSDSAELGRNRALRNGGLGIAAVPGVIDRGGNLARDNRDARQCTNVRCS
jgi:parallel beta-helix repeat protein